MNYSLIRRINIDVSLPKTIQGLFTQIFLKKLKESWKGYIIAVFEPSTEYNICYELIKNEGLNFNLGPTYFWSSVLKCTFFINRRKWASNIINFPRIIVWGNIRIGSWIRDTDYIVPILQCHQLSLSLPIFTTFGDSRAPWKYLADVVGIYYLINTCFNSRLSRVTYQRKFMASRTKENSWCHVPKRIRVTKISLSSNSLSRYFFLNEQGLIY